MTRTYLNNTLLNLAENRRHKHVSIHGEEIKEKVVLNSAEVWRVFNISLLVLASLLVMWIAFWSNIVATKEYKENLLEEKLSELESENNTLISQKSYASGLGSLLVFSKEAGLVEQKNIEYIFENKDIAQVR